MNEISVFSTDSEIEAEIVAQILLEAEIPSLSKKMAANSYLSIVFGSAASVPIEIFVDKADVDMAAEIIDAFTNGKYDVSDSDISNADNSSDE
ncbi:MAG: DUF2007 domain-containing protein [Clostridia bacterium]